MRKLILVACAMIALASCDQGAARQVQAKPMDGRALFRGLFFFEGDASSRIPLLSDVRRLNKIDSLNEYQMRAYNGYKEYTTKFIEKYYPDFFESFAAKLQSGNPILVDGALRRGGELVIESWALKPLLLLGRTDSRVVLSPKTQAALQRALAAKTIEDLMHITRAPDFPRDIILMQARDMDFDVRLETQRALNIYSNLDYFRFHNLDFALDMNLYRWRATNINITLNKQLNRLVDYNRMFNLNFDKDIDLGAGSWFNENEWLNENRYVNNNENFNVDKNVNVKEDVSVVVEAVIFAVVGFGRLAGLDVREQLLHEELVKSITQNFAVSQAGGVRD